ncbi:uncharacterized protein LOC114252485 [Bombyx mandarina]|uniref:Uncharacterized protein LOC114252485 n=1 Tax=Bombyx mandarina TaxID=7092 RepID=A0A6J2KRH8_BOMMA|nr:uncharacterized protein LOC114252485 [Bombyx mandarina]
MKILPLFVLIACVAWSACAQEEGEARPAQRGLLKRGLLTKGKPTTTTTTSAPQEYAEYEDEGDYPADGEAAEPSTEAAPPSSTEGKKLIAGGVRPFRSNNDLLEILKKKRAQAAEAKSRGSTVTESAAPSDAGGDAAKSNYSGKKRANTPAAAGEDTPAPAPKPSRGRFNRPSSRAVEPEAEEQNESVQPARSNRFSRRGNY